MKKLTKAFIFYILVALFISSIYGCSAKLSNELACKDIMQAAVDATDAPGYQKIYELNQNFDATEMSLWASGRFEETTQFSLVEECAVYISKGSVAYEVAVFKAGNSDDANTLLEVLENRLQTISKGDKAAYDPSFNQKCEKVKIYIDGNFAIMLLTEDNDAAVKAIDNLKK